MIKKLCKHGNSLALVIDRPILRLLGIDERTPLEISTEGTALIVTPARGSGRRRHFQSALTACNDECRNTLRRLAE
jgi:antitoxin MazE